VFGSRARDDFKKYSDLDLWLEAQPAISDSELSTLKEAFTNSDLAIEVDIVTPEKVLPQYLPQISKDLREF
jgi:predicted nucleotidyltransferase